MDIGYFGDARLKKMVRGCLLVSASGRRFVCASWAMTAQKRSGSGVF
jgi:hypothetical protein